MSEARATGSPATSFPPPGTTGTGFSHAKAILFGEHAVVYGATAVAVPVHGLSAEARVSAGKPGLRIDSELYAGDAEVAPRRLAPVVAAARSAFAYLGEPHPAANLLIRSAIPHERGLGSSAAVAAAVIRSIADAAGTVFDAQVSFDLVQSAERIAHGNPSGLDARAVVGARAIRFDAGVVAELDVGSELHLVIADSGTPGSTAQAVASVRRARATHREAVQPTLDRLAELASAGAEHITSGNPATVGALMNEAHDHLQQLGVSSTTLDSLVSAARSSGALGAKLTGGGLGGCIVALAPHTSAAEVIHLALARAGAARTWTTVIESTRTEAPA